MKYCILFIITFILAILDTSFMPHMSIGNFYPNLLTLYFFIYCLNNEKYSITFFAVYVGFIQEIFFNNSFGVNIFLNLSMGLILLYLSNKYNKNKYILSVFIITVVCMFKNLLVSLYVFIFLGVNVGIFRILNEFTYTFIILLFLYPISNVVFRSKFFRKALEF